MSDKLMEKLISQSPNRRNFVRKLGIASAVVGAAGATNVAEAQTSSADNDIAILNFALNLEYLEAEFYTVATTGMTIDQLGVSITGTGTAGATTGGSAITWSITDNTVRNVAEELATDERAHVSLLQGAITGLGGMPIAKPAINLNALGFGFTNQNDFLKLARIFEDIGVTAYGGAAPLIQTNSILGYAARILATEAEHSGNIRLLIDAYGISTAPPLDSVDILPPPSGSQFFSTDSNALTETRTPQEVLYLAYGGAANATSGGFFPNGVNGSFTTSSAAAAANNGVTFTATPNPIPTNPGQMYAATTLSWNAPASVQFIQIRIGSPSGGLFSTNFPSGSMATGPWVTDGMMFFLQDITDGKALTAANTLATVVVHFGTSSQLECCTKPFFQRPE
ncbi:MAG: ferritin-like domain-containing protein [Bryobacteraceae bacterium]